MNFGTYHLKYDPAIHDAKWGARLIYEEVVRGGSGIVHNRQTPAGEPEAVESIFPVLDRAMADFRKNPPGSGSHESLLRREGRVLVAMSPQGSYGYLYVTGVLEKEGCEGKTEVTQ